MSERILVVDDDEMVLELASYLLEAAGYRAIRAKDGASAVTAFEAHEPHVVLLDLHLPDATGYELLERFRGLSPTTPVVVVTADGAVDGVVRCMRLGAVDYVQKPFDETRLITSVRNAHERGALETRLQSLTMELRDGHGFGRILGESHAIREVMQLLSRAAKSDVSVLLGGESGTGKEVAARALHAESQRRNGPFVALNCGAIPEGLIESELFGHEKGAFTGADARRHGCFERAHGGTLFLDEIGELRLDLQVRLLRVLQEREVQRVGGSTTHAVDVRVVSAANRDLKVAAANGEFRDDLFYRLAIFPVTLPALRDRGEDVHLLADTFLDRFAQRHHRKIRGFTPRARAALASYAWPGNVRELENVIERAVILEDTDDVVLTSMPAELVSALADGPLGRHAERPPPTGVERRSPRTADDIEPLALHERRLLADALELTGWNIRQAARRLGIGRATMYRRIERFGLRKRVAGSHAE